MRRYLTNSEGANALNIFISYGKAVEPLERTCLQLMSHIEAHGKPPIKFTEFVADFIKGKLFRYLLMKQMNMEIGGFCK